MRKIGSLLDKRKLAKKAIDQQTVFYVFEMIIKEEYGRQGSKNIKPVFFEDKKIFIKLPNSFWASEISEQKKNIIKKINDQLGGDEIINLIINK